MPTLSAYRKNTVSLDTATLGENVDVEQSGLTLIPTSGAVVLANYKTHIGYRVLFSLRYHGEPLPFGAQAEVVASRTAILQTEAWSLTAVRPT